MIDADWISIARLPRQMPHIPTTVVEHLMMPYLGVPDDDSEDHRDAVRDAIDKLDVRSRECIEAYFFENIPYSELGERLGHSKPHAWRLTQKALRELQALLADDPILNERYDLNVCD